MSRTAELLAQGATSRTSAREVLAANLGADPWERIEELRLAGEKHAEAEGLAYQLERQRKSLLATLASEYARAHADENLSEAKLDRLARADDRYKKHIVGTAEAIKRREKLRSEYWALRSELVWDERAMTHLNALTRMDG